jgi:hypothetical protein
MKLSLRSAALVAVILTLNSCTDISQNNVTPTQESVAPEVAARISSLGFNPKDALRVSDGYLVEKDVVITDAIIKNGLPKLDASVPKEEQYRTSSTVTGLPRTITVRVAANLATFWVTATDAMIARYNALGLRLKFQRITSGTATVNIVKDESLPLGTLGTSGFPSGGNPYNTIRVKLSTFGIAPVTGFATTILTHEMGHCIGFRHTDYMARVCDKTNEGTGSLGAILIPGTSNTIDLTSWMISCSGKDTPFSSMDIIALNSLYK